MACTTCCSASPTPTYVSQADRPRASPQQYLKSPAEMAAVFADLPEALASTVEIARRCAFRPTKRKPILPPFDTKRGRDEAAELTAQAKAGLKERLAIGPARWPSGRSMRSGWPTNSASSRRWGSRATS